MKAFLIIDENGKDVHLEQNALATIVIINALAFTLNQLTEIAKREAIELVGDDPEAIIKYFDYQLKTLVKGVNGLSGEELYKLS